MWLIIMCAKPRIIVCSFWIALLQCIGRREGSFLIGDRLISSGVEEVVRQAWEANVIGSPMFQVAERIKRCRLALLQWNGQQMSTSAARIQELKVEMESLGDEAGLRDWVRWNLLKE